jgi:hypothetical protein
MTAWHRPTIVMVWLDQTIVIDIVLMPMARSSRPMAKQGAVNSNLLLHD